MKGGQYLSIIWIQIQHIDDRIGELGFERISIGSRVSNTDQHVCYFNRNVIYFYK